MVVDLERVRSKQWEVVEDLSKTEERQLHTYPRGQSSSKTTALQLPTTVTIAFVTQAVAIRSHAPP